MTQCDACQHWQRRGGVLWPAEDTCVVLEGERASDTLISIVTRMARALAADGRCPAHEPLPNEPDSYRSEDLPT